MSTQGPISSNSVALTDDEFQEILARATHAHLLELLQLSFAVVTVAMLAVLALACLNLKARCDRLDEWAEHVNVRLGVK